MSNLSSIVTQLEQERTRLTSQLSVLSKALSALNGSNSPATVRAGKMSAAGRARIAAAQRARWAKLKSQKVVSINTAKKRTLSPAALARIRAAQKARWAKWRKTKKTA